MLHVPLLTNILRNLESRKMYALQNRDKSSQLSFKASAWVKNYKIVDGLLLNPNGYILGRKAPEAQKVLRPWKINPSKWSVDKDTYPLSVYPR